ncbi:zinc-ribbon domain-containing protein [Companilactobacillus zhachilii]|jgi:Predicted membrane protein|uniref:zinc-ribbon domain-containing protein n=1 Tax=Companilactobacillus zhachilii TaxID=2304606 RepID=UPI004033E1DE
MRCSNCGAEIPADAEFCPECGHEAGVPVQENKTVSEMKDKVTPYLTKKNIFRTLLVVIVGLVVFAGYRLLYYPSLVKNEIAKTEFATANFNVKANVLNKTITLTASEPEVYSLVAASTDNGFLTSPIGAEESMDKMAKDLPGNWTIQLIQTTHANSPRVMWQYSDGHESIRYQNSNEYRRAKQAYIEASEKEDATNSEIKSAVIGAAAGGLIGAALR